MPSRIKRYVARLAVLICAAAGIVVVSAAPALANNWDPVIPYPGGCCNNFMYSGQHLTIQYNYPGSPYHLEMQTDGNLVLYSNSRACWASNTHYSPGAYAKYSWDGHLYLISSRGYVLWDSGFGGAWEVHNVSIYNGRFYVGGRFIGSC